MPFLHSNLYPVTKNFILGGTNYVALAIGIICIAGLLLPTQGEQNQRLPDYLHLSMNFKLIFSFVLGKHGMGGCVHECVCVYVSLFVYTFVFVCICVRVWERKGERE
jgi:hypothetical protein